MNYNEIGKTGMRVSNLSFGASSLGGVPRSRGYQSCLHSSREWNEFY
jgi:aryl-alcohol dehydrogenase-like predicted oxidoreductase